MKKDKSNHLKLGIVVTIAVVLLTLGIYIIGSKQHMFGKTFKLNCVFKNISGLQVGNHVRLSGINVGTVDAIEQINDSAVKVEMVIEEDSRSFIKKTATASIGSDGLVGSKLVVISPGSPSTQVVNDGEAILAISPVTFDEILMELKVTSENSAKITNDLSVIIGNIREGKGAVGKLFMDTTMGQDIADAITNIKQASGGLKQNMEAAKKSFFLRGAFKKKDKEDKAKKDKEDKEKKEKNESDK